MNTADASDPAGPISDASSPASPASPAPSWRKRHPVLARVGLYGAFVLVLAGGALLARQYQEKSAQDGLITRLQGLESGALFASPAEVVKIVREEILPKATDEDVERRAHLLEAAALDMLKRYDESDRVYRDVAGSLPPSIPKGAVYVPWANMRISAGKPLEALQLLDSPGATDGGDPKEVAAVRARAQRVLDGKEPAQGPLAPPAGPRK